MIERQTWIWAGWQGRDDDDPSWPDPLDSAQSRRAAVRALAPNAAAMVDLRQQLQAAGAITAERAVDVALAEPVVARMQRVAPGLQPQRQSAKPPAGKAASTMAAQPRRIPQPRLVGGFAWPDNTSRHHA